VRREKKGPFLGHALLGEIKEEKGAPKHPTSWGKKGRESLEKSRRKSEITQHLLL